MERLLISRVIGVLLLFFTCSLSFGQGSYYVFKKQGKPVLNTTKTLERGGLFSKSDTLFMAAQDYVLLVNEFGELFEISKPNKYAFSAIVDYKSKLESDSFTKKYFTYVWKQFTNQLKRKQQAGVVYREERKVNLMSPMDSVKMYAPEISFTWHNTTSQEDVFFFLRDLETDHLTKVGLTGNSIMLNLDNLLLKSGQAYEWSVSTASYPNLNTLKFNRIQILSKEEFQKMEKEIAAIVKAFTYLGFTEKEIQEAICLDYKFCTF